MHLPEPLRLFRFLCVLWGYSSNHGNQLDIKVGAVLQTQALYVGGALLGIHSTATLEMLAAADSPGESNLFTVVLLPQRFFSERLRSSFYTIVTFVPIVEFHYADLIVARHLNYLFVYLYTYPQH